MHSDFSCGYCSLVGMLLGLVWAHRVQSKALPALSCDAWAVSGHAIHRKEAVLKLSFNYVGFSRGILDPLWAAHNLAT